MDDKDTDLILQLFQAIDDDWAICDDNDEDQHMVLVNEDRDERDDLTPSKLLIAQMEDEGLIELDTERSDPKGAKREFMDFLDKKMPVPFVYLYKVTDKGRKLIAESKPA